MQSTGTTGAHLVTGALAAAGVRTVFTLSGNQIMPVFDACIDAGIRLIHVRHEAAAVYMAEAWAQLGGGVGVALLTAGPGFANGLSPLYSARASESPVLLLSGDAPLTQEGHGAFQELRQIELSAPLCKAAMRSTRGSDLGDDVARAVRMARSGRPGPVHLALPFDLLNERVAPRDPPPADRFEPERNLLDRAAVDRIPEIVASAERPLVITGPALNRCRASSLIERLAKALDAPVVPMESPRGLHDPALGDAARVIQQADLVLSLGKAIDFSIGFGRPPAFAARCRFAVVDPETELIERANRLLGERLLSTWRADADTAAEALVSPAAPPSPARGKWRGDVAAALAARPRNTGEGSPSGRILPPALCRAVQVVLDAADDPVLICDGGEFGQWAQACLSAPTRIINGPAGAIGGGLCYAVAAKIYHPGSTVVALMGDGTAGFHLSEFETALRCGAPFLAVIGNDARWNAEHQIQLRDYGPGRLIGCELSDARYDLAVAGLGGHGEYVSRADDLGPALHRAAQSGLPSCVNVRIEGLAAPAGPDH